MCNSEGRHSDGDAALVSNEDHQRQHKQQVIEAEKNVFDAKAQIGIAKGMTRESRIFELVGAST